MITTETLSEVLEKIEATEKPVKTVFLTEPTRLSTVPPSYEPAIQFGSYAALVAQLSDSPVYHVEQFFFGRYWECNTEFGDEASMQRRRVQHSREALLPSSLPFVENAYLFCNNALLYRFPTAVGYVGDEGTAIEYKGFGVIRKETDKAQMVESRFATIDIDGNLSYDISLLGIHPFLVFYPGEKGLAVSDYYLNKDASRTKEPAVSGSMGRLPAANVAAYDSTNLHLALPPVESAGSHIVDGPERWALTDETDPALLVPVPDLDSLRTSAILYRMNPD